MILRAEALLARALLAGMVALVFSAGVLRWFGLPLVWAMDVAQLLFVWASFIGADMAMRRRGLIAVDLFVRWIPPRFRAPIDLATGSVILAFLVAMVVLGYDLVILNLEREFGDSGISYGFVTAAVPAGCGLLALTLAGQLWHTARSLFGAPQLVFSSGPAPDDRSEPAP
ncbi:TRAP dicarboxylate transporter, periplasmic component [uncultured Alphaproteobacteria bacterium]|uniref:TRAP transporter small permease protein n=1 Tax=uncultured Alphaproteobacteria bacterium TaxID=91750 RepID=A0A212KMR0_9PROT|nr:TRAP dicarboxylate transporter, periplasmic component [uncultured Alphaproteobacteria bacterium]